MLTRRRFVTSNLCCYISVAVILGSNLLNGSFSICIDLKIVYVHVIMVPCVNALRVG